MSRIGKKPITIPKGTEITLDGETLRVKGPKGELTRTFPRDVHIDVQDGEVTTTPADETSKDARALWGTSASHILNMIQGVNEEYERKLEVEGVGYRVEVQGSKLVLNVGFSHSVEIEIPEGLDVSVEKNTITIKGINNEKVGLFAAKVRDIRKPEPYKGKGIRYSDEIIRRKEGKKTA